MLTPDMKNAFDTDGFLVVPGFVDRETCRRLLDHAHGLADELGPEAARTAFSTALQRGTEDAWFLDSGGKVRCFFDSSALAPDGSLLCPPREAVNKIGHALHDRDSVFSPLSRDPGLGAIAAGLGVSQPLLVQSMVLFKQAHTGGEVVSHQDATYLMTDPPSVLGFWLALEDADVENGCLRVLPGGHRMPLSCRYRRTGNAVAYDPPDPPAFDESRFIPLEAEAGTLIVLHGLLPHSSFANTSDRSRGAFTLHVVDGTCKWSDDNWLRPDPDMPMRGFDLADPGFPVQSIPGRSVPA
jgi:phytanoyl-CoA hydroxylase